MDGRYYIGIKDITEILTSYCLEEHSQTYNMEHRCNDNDGDFDSHIWDQKLK